MMTTIIPQIFTKVTDYKTPRRTFYATKLRDPTNSSTRRYVCCYHRQGFRLGFESSGKLLLDKDCFDEKITKKKRVVLVRSNNGGGGGGGGGRDDGGTARVLGNLALAIGLTYLSMTGQLGWILDAIVSVWVCVFLAIAMCLIAFLFPNLESIFYYHASNELHFSYKFGDNSFGYEEIDIYIKLYKKYYTKNILEQQS